MLLLLVPDNPDDKVWNCLGEIPTDPFLNIVLLCSFDMLIVVEYKNWRDFKRSMCNYRDNWNRHHKAPDDDDIGLREAFHRICV